MDGIEAVTCNNDVFTDTRVRMRKVVKITWEEQEHGNYGNNMTAQGDDERRANWGGNAVKRTGNGADCWCTWRLASPFPGRSGSAGSASGADVARNAGIQSYHETWQIAPGYPTIRVKISYGAING